MAERNTDGFCPPPVPPPRTRRDDPLDEHIYEEADPLRARDPSHQDVTRQTAYSVSQIQNFGSTQASISTQHSYDCEHYSSGLTAIDDTKKINLFKRSPKEFLNAFDSTHYETRTEEENFIIDHLLKKAEPNVPILEGNLEQLALLACCSSPLVVKRALDALLNEIFLSISDFQRIRCHSLLEAEKTIRLSFHEFLKVDHAKAKCQRMTTYAWLITLILLKCSKEKFIQIVTEIKRFDGTLKALLNANIDQNTFRYGIVLARETIKQIVHFSGKKDSKEPLEHYIKKCYSLLSFQLTKNEVTKLGKALDDAGSWLNLHVCLVFLQDLPKFHNFQANLRPITLIQWLIQDYRDRYSPSKSKNLLNVSNPHSWKFEILVYHVILRLILTSNNKAITTHLLTGKQGCESVFTQFQDKLKTTRDSLIAENNVKILERAVFYAPLICLNSLIEYNCKGNAQDYIEDLSILHLRSKYEDKVLQVLQISEVLTNDTRVCAYDVLMNAKKCLLKLYRHTVDDVLDQSHLKSVSFRKEIEIVKIMNALEEPCPNIVRMHGSSTEAPIHMIVESESTGDLVTFLNKHVNSTEIQNLIQIAADICNAMIFLHEQKIIHRDLRAKNCLVFMRDGKPLAKLGDFHRAVMAYSSSTIKKNLLSEFSVPWMAVETLQFGDFSTASDVWSYGVLLFEIFTFGCQPYVNMPSGLSLNSDEDVLEYVTNRGRLELHPQIPEPIQVIIQSTMVDADHRPTFTDIRDSLLGLTFKDEIYADSTYFKMSHVYELASPDINSRLVKADAGGCTANGCFGECLNATDIAVSLNVDGSHFIKEFVPVTSRDIVKLPKLECPSLAIITAKIFHDEKLELITEVGDMGSLKQFINEYGCSMEKAMRFLSQIGEAVNFLHNRRFIHRNLRADSVFVYSNGDAKLACFSRVKKLKPNADDQSSTIPINLPVPNDSLRWSSPEVITNGEYSKASDMWAFGVMIWEMFTLIDKDLDESDEEIIPYQLLSCKEQILSYLQRNKRLSKPNNCPDWLYEMMLMCWKHNTQDRAKAQDIVNFIKGHDINDEQKRNWFKDTFLDTKRKVKKEVHEKLRSFPWLCGAYGLTGPTKKIRRPHLYLTVKRGVQQVVVLRELEDEFKCNPNDFFELFEEPEEKPNVKYMMNPSNQHSFRPFPGGGVLACSDPSNNINNPLRVPDEIDLQLNVDGSGTLTMFCTKNGQHYALTCCHVGFANDENRLNASFNKAEDIKRIRSSLSHYENHAKSQQYNFVERNENYMHLGDFDKCCFDDECDILSLKVSNTTQIGCKVKDIVFPDWYEIFDELFERVFEESDRVEVEKVGFTSGLTNGYILPFDFNYKDEEDILFQDAFVVKSHGSRFLEGGDSGSLVFFYNKYNTKQVFAYGVCEMDKLPLPEQEKSTSANLHRNNVIVQKEVACSSECDPEVPSANDDEDDFEIEFSGEGQSSPSGKKTLRKESNLEMERTSTGPYFICFRLDTALENLDLEEAACIINCGSQNADGTSNFIKEFVPASSHDILKLSQLECPSLASITDIIFRDKKLELITEVGEMGNLKKFILGSGFSMDDAVRYLSQIGEAVSFLHLNGFIHRNLRANSVFVYSNGNAKLACFAHVTQLKPNGGNQSSTIPVNLPMPDDSFRWFSPEVMSEGEYSMASDIWAFGVVIWEMFTFIDKELDESDEEITPYHELSSKEQILSYLQRNKRLSKPDNCPDWLYEMMLRCWENNTQDRAKAQDIVECIDDQ